MTIFEALGRGTRVLAQRKRLCLAFYAATTVAALLITAPTLSIAMHSLGESSWAREMTGNLDAAWISELVVTYGSMPLTAGAMLVVGISAISLVVYLFLLGGALQVLCTEDPFFAGCGRNFWRIVKLALISLLFYGVALIIGNRVNAVGRKIWGEGSAATPLVYWGWFHAAVLLVLLGFVNLVFDYARVRMVADDQRKAWRAAMAAFRFVWRNLARTAGLYGMVCLIAGFIFLLYLGVSHSVAQTSMFAVLLLLVVRQAMVLAKIWSRLLFCSTAIEMYGALKPPQPVPLTAPEVEPDLVDEAPEPVIEVVLAPEFETNAFQFITAWNQTPECRVLAEARLPGLAGVSGVVFDPTRLTGDIAVLSRLADGFDSARLDDCIRMALAARGIDRPIRMVAEIGSSRVNVQADA